MGKINKAWTDENTAEEPIIDYGLEIDKLDSLIATNAPIEEKIEVLGYKEFIYINFFWAQVNIVILSRTRFGFGPKIKDIYRYIFMIVECKRDLRHTLSSLPIINHASCLVYLSTPPPLYHAVTLYSNYAAVHCIIKFFCCSHKYPLSFSSVHSSHLFSNFRATRRKELLEKFLLSIERSVREVK